MRALRLPDQMSVLEEIISDVVGKTLHQGLLFELGAFQSGIGTGIFVVARTAIKLAQNPTW